MVHQNDLIENITEQGFIFEQFKTYQIALKELEKIVQIKFRLNKYDPIQKAKSRSITQSITTLIEAPEIIY